MFCSWWVGEHGFGLTSVWDTLWLCHIQHWWCPIVSTKSRGGTCFILPSDVTWFVRPAPFCSRACLYLFFSLLMKNVLRHGREKRNVTWLLKHCHRPKFFVFSLSPSEHLGKLCQRLYDIPRQCPFLSFLLLVANITEQWSCIIIITIFYFVFYCLMGGIWIGSLFINSYLFKLFPIILFSEHVVSSMMLLHSCLNYFPESSLCGQLIATEWNLIQFLTSSNC